MIGQQILNYQVEKLIGTGGMGSVYLGHHSQLNRKVAIKALNPQLAQNNEIRQRFKNEAATLSHLQHPNIVTLHDYIEDDDSSYLVMEYVEGMPLDDYIDQKTGPIPEDKAIKIFTKILGAVNYAHQKNVIHRDIKPSNIIITPKENIKILDFGIAKILDNNARKLTQTGAKVGTVLYMSPEQVKSKTVDRRSDIYSLGVTFFQMLTGRCPYENETSEYDIYTKIVNEPLPEAKTFYAGVSDKMQYIINKATDKDPKNRFQSCQEFIHALNGKESEVPLPSESFIKAERKKRSRHFGLRLGIAFAATLILAIIYYFAFHYNKTQEIYVIADILILREQPSQEASSIDELNYGEKLELIDIQGDNNLSEYTWVKVRTKHGTEGYVAKEYLSKPKDFQLIKDICQDYSKLSAVYKKVLKNYFRLYPLEYLDNKGNAAWQLVDLKQGTGLPYAIGDFDENDILDFACLLEKTNEDSYKLLVFLAENDTSFAMTYENLTEIRAKANLSLVCPGRKGNAWYIGNRNLADSQPKKEYLERWGILISSKKKNKEYLLYYNQKKEEFGLYEQN